GAGRVGVETVDRRLDVGLGGVGRQVLPDRRDAHLGAVPVLARDVRLRPGVVAHQHRTQTGHDAPLTQRGDPLGQLGLDRRSGRLAVQDLRLSGRARRLGSAHVAVRQRLVGPDRGTAVGQPDTFVARRPALWRTWTWAARATRVTRAGHWVGQWAGHWARPG